MSNEVYRNTPIDGEEDDWDIADAGPSDHVQRTPSIVKSPQNAASLRPSAPAFVPKPAAPPQRSLYQPEAARPKNKVKDEDADEWFGVKRPVTNRQIWDSANNTPPPVTMTMAPSQAHSTGTTQLPPGPAMQILRRPTDNNSRSSRRQGQGGPGSKTLSEREEEYRLARERIFGPSAESSGSSSPKQPNSGRRSGSGTPTGRRSGGSSPLPGAQGNLAGMAGGDESGFLGIVPNQIRRTSGPGERRGGSSPGLGGGPGGSGGGIARQPRGPNEGGGFGKS